ncbi:hypothetical protein HDU97_004091 [Phlyctochytrium planicorne]|nr:hypothetical protein HDU97_004091 [Phlyctochytrium planicorne]
MSGTPPSPSSSSLLTSPSPSSLPNSSNSSSRCESRVDCKAFICGDSQLTDPKGGKICILYNQDVFLTTESSSLWKSSTAAYVKANTTVTITGQKPFEAKGGISVQQTSSPSPTVDNSTGINSAPSGPPTWIWGGFVSIVICSIVAVSIVRRARKKRDAALAAERRNTPTFTTVAMPISDPSAAVQRSNTLPAYESIELTSIGNQTPPTYQQSADPSTLEQATSNTEAVTEEASNPENHHAPAPSVVVNLETEADIAVSSGVDSTPPPTSSQTQSAVAKPASTEPAGGVPPVAMLPPPSV